MTAGTTRSTDLHLTAGASADGVWDVSVTPEVAGWGWTSLRVGDLAAGQEVHLETGDDEVVVVPLRGALTVAVEGQDDVVSLAGRASVWAGPTDVLYLPAGTTAVLTASLDGQNGDGARVALPGAKTGLLPEGVRKPVRHVPASEVAVELRGAGTCTREVRNFASADVDVASKLVAVEVVTPGGNWSSYPPHKHDETTEHESELEEVYYYEVAPGPGGEPGVGYHRTYGTEQRPLDVLAEVRDRDVVLVPHGWHGPCMASPGNHLYYLNAMAGPADDRAWRIVDDPSHAWVRSTWADQPTDPRLPLKDGPS